VLSRGDDPPEPPVVLARGDDPPEPPGMSAAHGRLTAWRVPGFLSAWQRTMWACGKRLRSLIWPLRCRAAGEAGAAAWTVRPSPRGVAVDDGASENARTVITAGPATVLRWLWGRAADSEVEITGDPAWAAYLRRMLTATTQ
jgi:hypothetical protein